MDRAKIVLPGAPEQTSFGNANRPITSMADIPHTITYTGITGATGHSYMYNTPVYKDTRGVWKAVTINVSVDFSVIHWLWKPVAARLKS